MNDMITTTLLPEPWTRFGACLEVDPDLWFPASRNEPTIRDAKRICNTVCEVREQCLEPNCPNTQRQG